MGAAGVRIAGALVDGDLAAVVVLVLGAVSLDKSFLMLCDDIPLISIGLGVCFVSYRTVLPAITSN